MAAASAQLTKRHEENKNRLKKRAKSARCRPQNLKGLGNVAPKPDDTKDDNKKDDNKKDDNKKDDNNKDDNKDDGKKDDNKDDNKKDDNKDDNKKDDNNKDDNKDDGKKDDNKDDNKGGSGNKDNNDPPPPPPHSGNSLRGQTFSGGDATFYSTGLNACGTVDKDSDFIAAIPHATFDSFPGAGPNPNKNPLCQKRILVTYKGRSITVRATDRCGGCSNGNSLDFSPSAFKALFDDFDLGRVHGISYRWLD
jgi:hypothetical protein